MFLLKAIEGFCLSKAADGLSPSTITRYRGCLELLSTFLENPDITEITQEDLQRFMVWLKTEYKPKRFSGDQSPLSGASLDNYWIAIRSFYTWASREFNIKRPDKDLERPKYQSDPIEPLTRADIDKLLQACKMTGGTENRYPRPTAKRDQAIIMLLLDTGIRRGELERLRIEDLTKDDRTGKYKIRIRPYRSGVKSQSRIVYTGNSASRYLWRYLADREVLYDEDPVFLSEQNRPLTGTAVYQLLRYLGKRTGVKDVHPHRFRHTFAIQYLRNGGDIYTLQRLLGHSTMEMVRNYLAIANSDDEKAHRRASPGDRWRL